MGSPFGTLAVIADPFAGGGRVGQEMPVVARELDRRELDHDLRLTTRPGEAVDLARDALEHGVRFLVAVGDDATVQDVLNGMFEDGRPIVEDAVLGVVAANSGCDLSRTMGLPEDTVGGCARLTGETTYPFDVIKIAATGPSGERMTRYAHNLAEVGLGAEVARRTRHLPARLGNARRFLAFWSAYARVRPAGVRVEADRKVFEGRAWNVIVANAQYSAGLRMSPRSFPGDGVLDALVFCGPKSDAYTMLPRIYRHGDHVPDPGVREMRAKIRVAIEADRPLPLVADGRVLGTTPATFQIVPRPILLKL